MLFHAAESNQRTAVDLLLRRGADPEIANYAGVIPSMAAQGRSHTHVARMLARAVDENPDDTGGEDGEVLSPANMEVNTGDQLPIICENKMLVKLYLLCIFKNVCFVVFDFLLSSIANCNICSIHLSLILLKKYQCLNEYQLTEKMEVYV